MDNTNKMDIPTKSTTSQKIEEIKKVVNLEIKFRKDEIKLMEHYSSVILNLEEIDLVSFLNRQIEPFEILDKKWQKQTKETICNNLFLQEMAKHIDYPDSENGRKIGGIEAVTELVLEKVIEKIRDEFQESGLI
jgi:hypothetical protein